MIDWWTNIFLISGLSSNFKKMKRWRTHLKEIEALQIWILSGILFFVYNNLWCVVIYYQVNKMILTFDLDLVWKSLRSEKNKHFLIWTENIVCLFRKDTEKEMSLRPVFVCRILCSNCCHIHIWKHLQSLQPLCFFFFVCNVNTHCCLPWPAEK